LIVELDLSQASALACWFCQGKDSAFLSTITSIAIQTYLGPGVLILVHFDQ
jgi:hypothetical protein